MNDDHLQEIWDRRPEERTMSQAEIEDALRPHAKKSLTGWNITTWTYLAFIAGTLVCEGMHLHAFRNDPLILTLGIGATLLTLGFLAYGIRVLRRSTAIEASDESLVVQVRRRLRFHRTELELWHWMLAVTFVFLSLAVSTLLDIEDGTYRINQAEVFAGILLAQLLFGYAALKLGLAPFVRESRAILHDLEDQVTTGTEAVRQRRRAWRVWSIALAILFAVLFVYGLVRAFG